MDLKKSVIGIELGSTRIKAVLLDENLLPVASGSHEWENRLVDGVWTYTMQDITHGIQSCYADLKKDVRERFGVPVTQVAAIGVSAMMHGYLPFDDQWNLLTPFRTWRNTMTGAAAEELTKLFSFNIPQRWSIAHLYQAMLNKEEHVPSIRHLTTLAGYIHFKLTGVHAVGVGEASGMFPIDSETNDYDAAMMAAFDQLPLSASMPWKLKQLLPQVLLAGQDAGTLTADGAAFLDPAGDLQPGIPMCPAEGDAGTGMAATNSVRVKTGNVSAGTSDFAMVVVEKRPGVHREIDMVTTPTGKPVAMVHCNNCTADINAWVTLFGQFAEAAGFPVDKGTLFTLLFRKALEGAPDGGGLMSVNYLSGEGVTDFNEGRPLFLRKPDAPVGLASFMRTHLMSALATLKLGMDILAEEQVAISRMYGHGGYFKTPEVGQRMLSAAINAPVTVMQTAGEGGPYGMALLAAFRVYGQAGQALEDFLDQKVFATAEEKTLQATAEEVEGFNKYIEGYKQALKAEKALLDAGY